MEIDVAVKKSPLLGEGFSLGSFAVLAEAVANKAAQRNLRTGAVMTDDFGRADAADHGAGAETAFLGYAVQKTGGIQIAGTGRIDDVVDFFGFDKDFDAAVDNDRTFGIAGNGGDFDQRLDQIERFVEVIFGKQGFEFFLIAEKNVDMIFYQIDDFVLIAQQAGFVRQAEGDFAVVFVCQFAGLDDGFLG